jgi:hypothetical protein
MLDYLINIFHLERSFTFLPQIEIPYRLIDLIGTNPLFNLDMKISYIIMIMKNL